MNTLLTCIEQEATAMTALVEILQEEQALLTQAPSLALMEEISAITHKKNQIVSSISHAGQMRSKELSRLGFNTTPTTMPQWLQDKEQIAMWDNLIIKTRKANELNRVNGILINRHLVRNQNTLQVLQQNHQNTNQDATVYGADGQSNTQRTNGRGVVA